MERIIKNQPDWDDAINKNFSKFGSTDWSDNVVYLNGTQKDATLPLQWSKKGLGDITMFVIQGYVKLPDISNGQSIDVFNIPGINTTDFQIGSVEDGALEQTYLTPSTNGGTITFKNYSGQDQKAHNARISIIIISNNRN
ncbi:hypothetical protein [Limosilactobacillus walteri]|uniref:Uncharacterized protein n=1 Tax=Limosilactobacillus walteri TaxID=2268022 RepID=A0ABR8P840_9LACO|nr:hypothetical protein [Limosilactobacillus walteri]MBD5806885.1 hypothetical protein [Limosilactobacillus walteri]